MRTTFSETKHVQINAAVAMVPSRISAAGVTVRGMSGVAVAVNRVRVVATVSLTVATGTMPASVAVVASAEPGIMSEIPVAAVAVRRIVMRTVAVIIVMLSLGERAKGEE